MRADLLHMYVGNVGNCQSQLASDTSKTTYIYVEWRMPLDAHDVLGSGPPSNPDISVQGCLHDVVRPFSRGCR